MDVSQLCIDPSSNTSEDIESNHSFHLNRISISSVNNSSSTNVHNSSPSVNSNSSNLYEYNNQQHPISATTTENSNNDSKHNNENDDSQQRRYLLRNVIDRCKLLQSNMSQYRDQPLTEALRSSLLDQVHCATASMLESLAILENDTSLETDNSNKNNINSISSSINSFPETITEENKQEYSMIRQARNITETSRPKYRRRSKRSMAGQRCHSCNTTETPEWRRGPDGARTLCNACGLHYSKLLRKKSLTVQTHNYLLDQRSEEERVPWVIQFPIVQMSPPNNNNNINCGNSNSNNGNNNNSSGSSSNGNIMRLPTISTNRPSPSPPSSDSPSHLTIYELSQSELESIQRDSSWKQS